MSHDGKETMSKKSSKAKPKRHPGVGSNRLVRAQCQANVKRDDDLEACGKPATAAVVQDGDYVPVCGHHAKIARRNKWAVGSLRSNEDYGTPAR